MMDRRTALKTISAGIAAPCLAAPPAFAHPDEHLLQLGSELDAAREAGLEFSKKPDRPDAEFEAVFGRLCRIVNQIEKTEATSLEGLRIKARAFNWCNGDDGLGDTTDCRLAEQIISSILKI